MTKACMEGLERRKKGMQVKKECGLLPPFEEEREKKLFEVIRNCMEQVRHGRDIRMFESRMEEEQEKAGAQREELTEALGNVIGFVKESFGTGQELIVLLTGILEHPGTGRVMREELSEEYRDAAAFLNTDDKEEALKRRL